MPAFDTVIIEKDDQEPRIARLQLNRPEKRNAISSTMPGEIRQAVEDGPDAGQTQLTDLHVWRVGRQAYACALTVVTHDPQLTSDVLRQRLAAHEEIVHATIEVQHG